MNVIRWLVESIEMGRIDDRDASFIQKQFYGDTYWKIIKSTIFRFYGFFLQISNNNRNVRNLSKLKYKFLIIKSIYNNDTNF